MNSFIRNIFEFLMQMITSLRNAASNFGLPTVDAVNAFLAKPIFTESSLIGLNATWYELFVFFGTLFLAIFFIALFVKFVFYIIKWVGGFLSD